DQDQQLRIAPPYPFYGKRIVLHWKRKTSTASALVTRVKGGGIIFAVNGSPKDAATEGGLASLFMANGAVLLNIKSMGQVTFPIDLFVTIGCPRKNFHKEFNRYIVTSFYPEWDFNAIYNSADELRRKRRSENAQLS
ncbi:MAG: hypothetical protein LBB38_04105, partial [Puniceicoccales bacterium]|nr:hypothetical protein [Puniceicoccales bacterium]